jgi:endo-1,4-beta-D-glucanase Y
MIFRRQHPQAGANGSRAALVALGLTLVVATAGLHACSHPGFSNDGTGGTTGVMATDGGADRPRDVARDAGPSRGPVPPQPGIRFPFPQNRTSAGCIYPTNYRNEDVIAAYNQWKADTVTATGAGGHLRVRRPNEPGLEHDATVSEGIGYGMLIAVYMGDADSQHLFDELWKYEQLHRDELGLMDWYISADGSQKLGIGGAGDADEDMAFALIMADRQWGGQGTLDKSYLDSAKEQLANIWLHEVVDGKLLSGGDHGFDWHCVNISYFAPAYYRVFAKYDHVGAGSAGWDAVVKTVYDTIDNALNPVTNGNQKNQSNGLVPAWCDSAGPPNGTCPTGATNYQYDACRTPFRIGLDACWFGTPAAKSYLGKVGSFFNGVGAAKIVDGYGLDGTPQPSLAVDGGQSAAFVGPAGVSGMVAPGYPSLVDQTYAALATRKLLVGGTYYDESWTVLSLLMMTGNFIDYTAY